MLFNDTIAAIATPPGEGAIGIVRISGPDALAIGQAILRSPKGALFANPQPSRLYYGNVIDPGTGSLIDEALFFYAKKPRSFTGEDTLEIQAHGGTFIISKILGLTQAQGARLAEPGEFTQRAFLNGRVDLVQAESIIDLIRAKTDQAHKLALAQLKGQASRELEQIETGLYQLLIAIEAVLDFPEEGIPPTQRRQFKEQVGEFRNRLKALLEQTEQGRKIREGFLVVIAGPPNVGKSSLLNTLLQEERAIVTPIPGTTRDIIEAEIQLGGYPIRLIDTAGLRVTDNPIEKIGIGKAEEYIDEADLILLVIDGSEPLNDAEHALMDQVKEKKVLIIINKTDLPQQVDPEAIKSATGFQVIATSLLTGTGVNTVITEITALITGGKLRLDEQPLLSRLRHKQALQDAISALNNLLEGLAQEWSEDLLAVELRYCMEALGSITGKNVTTEVVHGIFSQFCIGK